MHAQITATGNLFWLFFFFICTLFAGFYQTSVPRSFRLPVNNLRQTYEQNYLPQEGSGFKWKLGGGMIATQMSKGIWEAEEINLTLKISLFYAQVICTCWPHLAFHCMGWEQSQSVTQTGKGTHVALQPEPRERNLLNCPEKALRNLPFIQLLRA